jgi:predicted nucleic acid-binding protein
VALILDSGVVFAALDADDPDHEACAELLSEATEALVVPGLTLAEVDYWCERRLGPRAWLEFLGDLIEGAYELEHPTQSDLERCLEIQRTYADLEAGVVDASVLALAERLGEQKLATLDHRHFATMRPRHAEALELLPGGL